MLVIIPTYKRVEALRWVLISLIKSELPNLLCKPRLAIINNYSPNKKEIENIVENIKVEYRENSFLWDWFFISRDKTLPPIENWYSALDQLAKPSEIVFFLGDDDPLTEWSIKRRYEEIVNSNANFLSGRLCSGLYFHKNYEYVYFEGNVPTNKYAAPELINSENIWDWTVIHISNHCFKYDDDFKEAIKLAYEWTDSQSGVSTNYRTLFMPFYIALALLKLGNKLIGIDEIIAFRGQSVEEIQKIGGETRVWNLGFMSLLCYDILLMFFPDDKKMLNVKNILLNEFKRQYYTISFDKSIEKTEKEYMFGKYNDLIKTITLPNTLYGMYIHYKSFLRLSGILLNIKASIKGIQAKTFFENAQ